MPFIEILEASIFPVTLKPLPMLTALANEVAPVALNTTVPVPPIANRVAPFNVIAMSLSVVSMVLPASYELWRPAGVMAIASMSSQERPSRRSAFKLMTFSWLATIRGGLTVEVETS